MTLFRQRAAIVINPISGRGRDEARVRVERAAALAAGYGMDVEILVTERAGHAWELTRVARDRGVVLVVAWGGDGTINEVGSALAFGDARLAIVPSGSGNGLARALGVPADPEVALRVAVEGQDRVIDAGELDDRLFFNVAGIGFDAQVAHRFAAAGRRRGPWRYVVSTAGELLAFAPSEYVIETDGAVRRTRPLLIALANGRQYGNGATIAPQAMLDDGNLDIVVVEHRSPWRLALEIRHLFTGQLARCAGVAMGTATAVTIRGTAPIAYHVDGEPFVGGETLVGRVRPGALTVRVPA
jgi:diacylglycerol kinase (ATP)